MYTNWSISTFSAVALVGKISAQPHPTLCIQFLNRENNDKNNTFPLGKQICFTIVWGCAETLPDLVAKVKNVVALAPVLGAISRPAF